jgi:hypothetical protein
MQRRKKRRIAKKKKRVKAMMTEETNETVQRHERNPERRGKEQTARVHLVEGKATKKRKLDLNLTRI